MLQGAKIGRTTIDGIPCISITFGGVMHPANIVRTYEDIERIIGKADPEKLFVAEDRTPAGKFKRFVVSTTPLP